MTRMCSYAKISKGGAGSADELRDTGSIILCAAPLPANSNFFLFFFFFLPKKRTACKRLRSRVVPLKLVAYC